MAVTDSRPSFGEVLVKDGIITQSQLKSALGASRSTSHSLGRVMVEKGYITEAMRIAILQKSFGYDLIDLSKVEVDPIVLTMIPSAFAQKHRLLPIRQEKGALVMAMEDPSDLAVMDAIKSQIGMPLKPYVATSEELVEKIDRHFGEVREEQAEAEEKIDRHGRAYRILRATAFPVLCFLPIVLFVLLAMYYEPFNRWLLIDLRKTATFFDIGLYFILGWALWTIILFEINGLIFKPEETILKEEDKEK